MFTFYNTTWQPPSRRFKPDELRCGCVFSCSDSPDYIVVRDGIDAGAPVIAQYCNSLNAEQVLSSSHHLYIDFIVNDKNQRQGFEATFAFIKENQLPSDGSSSIGAVGNAISPHSTFNYYPGEKGVAKT